MKWLRCWAAECAPPDIRLELPSVSALPAVVGLGATIKQPVGQRLYLFGAIPQLELLIIFGSVMTRMLNRRFAQIKWRSKEFGFVDSVSAQWAILAGLLAALSVIGAVLYSTPRWQFFHHIDFTWIRALDSPILAATGNFNRGRL
jgi:hypothetical protein